MASSVWAGLRTMCLRELPVTPTTPVSAPLASRDTSPLIYMFTVSNAWETVCGHLLEGSHTGTDKNNTVHAGLSHFTVAIAKVSGVVLRATKDKTGYYHELVPA